MTFSEFVMLPIRRFQTYLHAIGNFTKEEMELQNCNPSLLHMAAILVKKLEDMRSKMLDYLQICSVSIKL